MPLPDLLNVPKTKSEWDIFSFAHRDHTTQIQQAIFSQSNGADNLFQYELDPINKDQISDWLERNQQTHDDFNAVLGLQGVDLSSVNINDPKQMQAWIYLHWQEHASAATALAI